MKNSLQWAETEVNGSNLSFESPAGGYGGSRGSLAGYPVVQLPAPPV